MESGPRLDGPSGSGSAGRYAALRTTMRRGNSDMSVSGSPSNSPEAIPKPGSPTPPVQLTSWPSLSVRLPPRVSSFDKSCAPSKVPVVAHGRLDPIPIGQICELFERPGNNGKDSKEVLRTRSASTADGENKLIVSGDNAMDTLVTVTGKRGRPPADVVEFLNGATSDQE